MGPRHERGPPLELTLLPDLRAPCPENHVYVYSGVPPFVLAGQDGGDGSLLGAFCGSNLTGACQSPPRSGSARCLSERETGAVRVPSV